MAGRPKSENPPGIRCPHCGCARSQVIGGWNRRSERVRRRACVGCGGEFTSLEKTARAVSSQEDDSGRVFV